jgi:hypothetical protein
MPDAYRNASSRGSSAPNGRFAFWIGDEGIKAKANLPDAYAHTSSGVPVSGLSPWELGLSGNAAQRTALELANPVTSNPTAHDLRITAAGLPADFGSSFRNWRDNDIQSASAPEALALARFTVSVLDQLFEFVAVNQFPEGVNRAAFETAFLCQVK